MNKTYIYPTILLENGKHCINKGLQSSKMYFNKIGCNHYKHRSSNRVSKIIGLLLEKRKNAGFRDISSKMVIK